MISVPTAGLCSAPHPVAAAGGYLCGRLLLGHPRPGRCPTHPRHEQTAPPLPPPPDRPAPPLPPVPQVRLGGRPDPGIAAMPPPPAGRPGRVRSGPVPDVERVPVRCGCGWEGRRVYDPRRAAHPCPSCGSRHRIARRALNTRGPGYRWVRWPGELS